jgi:hypothetical protein
MLVTSNCFRSEEATQQYFTTLNQCLLNIKTRVSVASKTRRKIIMKRIVQTPYEAYISSYTSVTTMTPQQEINIYTAQ